MSQLILLIMAIVTLPIVAVFALIARSLDKWSSSWGEL